MENVSNVILCQAVKFFLY